MKIDTLKRTVDIVLNKNHKGVITPDRFNNLVEQEQYALFSHLVDIYRQQSIKKKTNISGMSFDEVKSTLDIFKTRATISESSGVYKIPDDCQFYERNAIIYGGSVVDVVQQSDFTMAQSDYLTPVSEYSPIALIINQEIEIIPDDAASTIKFYYYRKPIQPKWAYEELSTGVYVFDSINSTDLEIPEIFLPRIVAGVLSSFGIHIREPQITQMMEQEQNSDYTKNMQ